MTNERGDATPDGAARLEMALACLHDIDLTIGDLYESLRDSLSTNEAERGPWAQHATPKHLHWKPLVTLYRSYEASHGLTSPARERILTLLLREVDGLRFVLSNLIAYLEGASVLPKPRTLPIALLLEPVVELADNYASQKGIRLDVRIQPDVRVFADPIQIQRVFVNIINNAIKYSFRTSDRGQDRFILVEARRHDPEGAATVIRVSSYGVGILPEEITSGRVFEYGYRGQLAQAEDRRGSGIGLAESKRIVDLHRGKIAIHSQEVSPSIFLTTVSIILPAKQPLRGDKR